MILRWNSTFLKITFKISKTIYFMKEREKRQTWLLEHTWNPISKSASKTSWPSTRDSSKLKRLNKINKYKEEAVLIYGENLKQNRALKESRWIQRFKKKSTESQWLKFSLHMIIKRSLKHLQIEEQQLPTLNGIKSRPKKKKSHRLWRRNMSNSVNLYVLLSLLRNVSSRSWH